MYRAEGLYNHEFAPFLNGYIGEHVEFYQPGAMQLAGFPHAVRSDMTSIRESHYYFFFYLTV